jgi:hypothetical protein
MPAQFDMDITVSRTGVVVKTTMAVNKFPQPGESAHWIDVGDADCFDSESIKSGGMFLDTSADVTGSSDAVLMLAGCGGSANIPIGGVAPPVPTFTATRDSVAGTITVTWDATPTASTALVELGNGFTADVRHTTDHQIVFGTQTPNMGATVWPFAAMTSVDTDYGTARVWTGDPMDVTVP